MSLTGLFIMLIVSLEMPVSGWSCLNTLKMEFVFLSFFLLPFFFLPLFEIFFCALPAFLAAAPLVFRVMFRSRNILRVKNTHKQMAREISLGSDYVGLGLWPLTHLFNMIRLCYCPKVPVFTFPFWIVCV